MTKTFIIAEAGVNHNGDEGLALELVDLAAACGADAVKFQTFKAEKLVTLDAKKAEYQSRQTGGGNQFAMLKALELSEASYLNIHERCKMRGIEFMSTPFDQEAADFLLGLGMRRLKVPSGELTNHPFLEYLAQKDIPIILSSGMATLDEISEAVEVIRLIRHQSGFSLPLDQMLTILHCTSNYPASYSDVHLNAMRTIAAETGLPVGYSDHTNGLAVSTAAVALGATVIEKHFTLDQNLPGPDHQASLSPEELSALVKQIRNVEDAMGSFEKKPSASELPIRDLVRRSVTSVRPLKAGESISASDLTLLRPGTGIPPAEFKKVLHHKPLKDIPAGATLNWSDLA
ncbi:N-acetylneuraminate synthase [Methylophilus methylotrophus]|uniref:N-acetylneuraminate synthase n=1 Tax=Methylophilus methylotrophus TaxID=17 RepID=UPI000F5AB78D|nr:N-acetylneuraminate synthase [Methylophilus methylotrophus]